jgi:hypothetical protein
MKRALPGDARALQAGPFGCLNDHPLSSIAGKMPCRQGVRNGIPQIRGAGF